MVVVLQPTRKQSEYQMGHLQDAKAWILNVTLRNFTKIGVNSGKYVNVCCMGWLVVIQSHHLPGNLPVYTPLVDSRFRNATFCLFCSSQSTMPENV